MLPIHPRPQPDELLSSWMTRLAIENGYYSHCFFKDLIGLKEDILRRDLDRDNSYELVSKLSLATGSCIDDIVKLRLSSLQGEVFPHESLKATIRWVLPLGMYHRIKRRRGVVYCPLCLKNDEVKYFRRNWRLAFVNLCEKHGCVLLDRCVYCNANIDYQRVGIGFKEYDLPSNNIGSCFNCHKPLWHAPAERLSINVDRFSKPYRDFISNYESGLPLLPELNVSTNLLVLNGLWILAGRLASQRAVEVRARISKMTGIAILPMSRNTSFEGYPIEQRMYILIAILYYLQDWPYRFIKLVSGTAFTLTALGNDIEHLPYWLRIVAFEYMNSTPRVTTNEEIASAMRYLDAVNPNYTKSSLASLLGLEVSSLNRRLKELKKENNKDFLVDDIS